MARMCASGHPRVQVGTSVERERLLLDLIMQAMADDYEDFDTILHDVGNWARESGIPLDAAEVEKGIKTLIQNSLARAYHLSPTESPELVRLEDLTIRAPETYFLLTPEGKLALQRGDDDTP